MHSWLFMVLSLATVSSGNRYHIVPVNTIDLCQRHQNGTCSTLEQLVQTDLLSGGDNLTLNFLPGDHVLNELLFVGNFKTVLIAGQNSTIKFNKTGSMHLSSIKKLLSIKGLHFTGESGETILNMYSFGKVLITECFSVYLKLLKLESCTLLITGTVTVMIEQVLFVSNTGTNRALHVEADNVYIEKSNFFSNDGGAVHIKSTQAVINDSRFNSNSAAYGGAVDMVSKNVTISFCDFINNSASIAGGAINYADVGSVSIHNCELTNNSAEIGGAIYADGGSVSVYKCEILNNSADFFGGAIYTDTSSLSIYNCELPNNSAKYGGAIYAFNSSVSIYNCELITNNSADLGGAIYADTSSLSIYNCKLFNNITNSGGGAIYTDTSSVSIYNCELLNNSAQFGGGGAINAVTGSVSIYNCELFNNSAGIGGAIYANVGSVSIYNSELTNHSAYVGGAVNVATVHMTISFCKFTDNSAFELGGAIYANEGSMSIYNCELTNNIADIGGAILTVTSSVSIKNCELLNNVADYYGGAVYANTNSVSIHYCELHNNIAGIAGAAIYASKSSVSIHNSKLAYNNAKLSGGVMFGLNGELSISYSELSNNSAAFGGVIGNVWGNVSILNCTITDNKAVVESGGTNTVGGAVFIYSGNISISKSMLKNNSAKVGGVIFIINGTVIISDSVFTSNSATQQGGVMVVAISTLTFNNTSITDNLKGEDVIYAVGSNLLFTGINNVSNNKNPVHALSSRVEFNGAATLSNNHGVQGGAIRAVQSQIYINAEGVIITNNTATFGGGVFLRESTLFVYYPIEISYNTAQNGGGIYAYSSEIEFDPKVITGCELNNQLTLCTCIFMEIELSVSTIDRNEAQLGGGIYALASNIKVFTHAYVHIKLNSANNSGGGMYLQQSSKIYVLKQEVELKLGKILVKLEIYDNTALMYGGGIFVADSTESGACRGDDITTTGEVTQSQCFIQTLSLYGIDIDFLQILADVTLFNLSGCLKSRKNYCNTFLANNTASKSGADIYGGLLDRCTMDVSAELSSSDNGFEYLNNTVLFSSIASEAVRVQVCNTTTQFISVRKGQKSTISVMAVDQVGNPVNATIRSSVITESGVGRLKEGQAEQKVGNQCTKIEYNVFSQDSSAQVELYAEGPCINLGISKQIYSVSFLSCTCPIGLKPIPSSIECKCDCDPFLQQEYKIKNCSEENGTITLESNSNIWIGVTNTTNRTGYVVSKCTFDYCVQRPVNISLSSPDRQCAFNRSGVLCGECKSNFSLVLGTSRCEQCSNIYLLLLIPFALAGILLVAFILLFNFTIATGTIHGLICYTNILAASQSIFLPFHNALTVFISWVNLDLGIETCFYNGMNSQAKVLLQLVFPVYLFLLMFVIIILSKYFSSFAKLLSNRNPVAALGTLILLSYSKLLRFIIAALQYRVLDYPNGSTKVLDFPSNSSDIVWLYDGNVQYFTSDHNLRFIVAAIILTAGGLYTVLLFFGQWFTRCSNWKLMKWTKNVKYNGFMDVYHAPFTPKHRYWVGLLLLAMIAHNVVAAMAPDTSLPVLSSGVLSVGIIGWKLLNNRLYKNKFCDSLETLYLLNVAFLAFGTSYVKDTMKDQSALANTSMAISFIIFAITLCYHFYQFVLKKSNTWLKMEDIIRSVGAVRTDTRLRRANNGREVYQLVANENNDDELLEVLDDYEQRDYVYPPYTDCVREEADPDRYITPPIIRPATRPDQLREPALDVLAPLTTEDYRPAPPPPGVNRRPVVTHTEIAPIHEL